MSSKRDRRKKRARNRQITKLMRQQLVAHARRGATSLSPINCVLMPTRTWRALRRRKLIECIDANPSEVDDCDQWCAYRLTEKGRQEIASELVTMKLRGEWE